MSIDLSKPITWTSRGNVNEDDALYEKLSEWEFRNAAGELIPMPAGLQVLHAIGLKDRETGEIIKRGVYAIVPSLGATAEHGSIN